MLVLDKDGGRRVGIFNGIAGMYTIYSKGTVSFTTEKNTWDIRCLVDSITDQTGCSLWDDRGRFVILYDNSTVPLAVSVVEDYKVASAGIIRVDKNKAFAPGTISDRDQVATFMDQLRSGKQVRTRIGASDKKSEYAALDDAVALVHHMQAHFQEMKFQD
ncbi:hypothetical protein B5E41_30055 [Rhizobium esperanzae]|uniref:Uncharacterized protein n=1 Tax=Rhizobium esperanzae TaxID=1967781 RepID=A0A246DKT9_9HYPH|nr:hypothetical protein [Rhizobium esperanzae]OWO89725.1 hypothetical protein B5E41_30055 [Rhizobium esperanzae]